MTDADQILAVIDAMFAAFAAHDPAGVEAALDPDCTIWDVFVPQLIVGVEARLAFHDADRAQSEARGPLRLQQSEPLIGIWGDIGLARYVLRFDYAPPNAASGSVRISTLFRRDEGGALRIIHHHEGLAPAGVSLTESSDPA